MAAYPTAWESDAVLADGGTVRVRPIRDDDGGRLVDLHHRLSDETVYFRFFSPHPELSTREIERFTHVDYSDRMALVATLEDRLVAVARYDRHPGSGDAEVAFVVEDAHQGRGMGTLLLEHLAAYAREQGVVRFVAETLPHNRPMLGVFRDAGFRQEARFEDGVVRVVFPIAPTATSEAAADERDRRAVVRSIDRLLRPRSVAVIGASNTPGTIGAALLRNLLEGGFRGPVYPVHPTDRHVASVRAWPSVLDVPDEVDLAVVAVPAAVVPEVVEACGVKGVRGLVVVSSGFAESGPEGAAAERAVVASARAHGMRLVGPNCMGLVNTDPGVSLNATFAPLAPTPGNVAFSSQSGGLGISIMAAARRLGVGLSAFVSAGNKADVSGNDLLRYWEEDERTRVVLLYLESFGNPRMFSRIARRVSRRKPIVAVKGGRTEAGTRAASSHTAAVASADTAVDALFRQTGVVRVDTLEELFDVGRLFATQPVPRGRRLAVVGNAGGPGILAADAAVSAGLDVSPLAAATQAGLRAALPAGASVVNPVDVDNTASAADYETALRLVLADDGVDAVLVQFVPPFATGSDDVAAAVGRAAAGADKPVVAVFLALDELPGAVRSGDGHVPVFAFPEAAVRALARACDHADWLARPEGAPVALDGVDRATGARVVTEWLAANPAGGVLPDDVTADLLAAYGVPLGSDLESAAAIGVAQDRAFGPLVTLAAPGLPPAFRIVPLTEIDADELVAGLADVMRAPLRDVVLRVARLADDVVELDGLEARAGAGGLLGAAIRVVPPPPRAPAVRRMRAV